MHRAQRPLGPQDRVGKHRGVPNPLLELAPPLQVRLHPREELGEPIVPVQEHQGEHGAGGVQGLGRVDQGVVHRPVPVHELSLNNGKGRPKRARRRNEDVGDVDHTVQLRPVPPPGELGDPPLLARGAHALHLCLHRGDLQLGLLRRRSAQRALGVLRQLSDPHLRLDAERGLPHEARELPGVLGVHGEAPRLLGLCNVARDVRGENPLHHCVRGVLHHLAPLRDLRYLERVSG
mmetsp:Transcript_22537/g.56910  ORF Transcript_22537/g.56910 Transcript_22537/m.56910 type:complete len:234 (-) Transcript_22537:1140-1841(-)